MYPSSVDRLPVSSSSVPQPPSRAQTVTNNLAVGAIATPSKDINIRGGTVPTGTGSMDGVETVRVTDITSSSAFTKSIGSLFSSINKSVSSAFNSLMAAPTQDLVRTTAGTPAHPVAGAAAVSVPTAGQPDSELDNVTVSMQGLQQQQQQLGRDERPYQQQVDWRRVQPQSYAEQHAYRGNAA